MPLVSPLLLSSVGGSYGPPYASVIVVTSAQDLSVPISSDKVYVIDGEIDMGTQRIEVPPGGIYLIGFSVGISKLVSSEDNYTMFTSPPGGSGNVFMDSLSMSVSGASSKVYDLTDATGFSAIELLNVNYEGCTSLGTLNGFRQGLESNTGRFGGTPNLVLSGNWLGGFFINTSIVRSLVDGSYALFEEGTSFTMQSRFATNWNIDLPANTTMLDFQEANFPNPSTLQLKGCIITRNGVSNPNDTNYTPNINHTSLSSQWRENTGLRNTYEGGKLVVTTEVETAITSAGDYTLLLGTYTSSELQHFDQPVNGQLRNNGDSPIEYKVFGSYTLIGGADDVISLRIRKSDGVTTETIGETAGVPVNNFPVSDDKVTFNFQFPAEINKDEYIFVEVANNTDTTPVTLASGSFIQVSRR